jgi:CBS domain-containing protein
VIRQLLTTARWKDASPGSLDQLAKLLAEEGVDLMAADASLERGTPVYAHFDADVLEVQRLMAKNHIRMLPVVKDGRVLGVVDLVELAMRDDLDAHATIGQAATD